MMIIITLNQKNEWMGYLKKAYQYDFYHSWIYHTLDKGGKAILLVYQEDADFIAFPFILKQIKGTVMKDLGSVYGYSGPLSNKKFDELGQPFIERYKKAFLLFLISKKIVSVFSRLHPFLDQEAAFSSMGGVHKNGQVVALDLTVSLEKQREGYQESLFKKIIQLKREGFYVKISDQDGDVKTFYTIYQENMSRLGASDSYMFPLSYFIALLQSEEFDAKLIFVYNKENMPICGMITVFTNEIAQAHLLGTRSEYLCHSPAKLLIDEVSVIGRALKVKYFNLGGGLGFKEDSLFKWKGYFSDLKFAYNSWRYIADQGAYADILKQNKLDPKSEIDFFPLYRSPSVQSQGIRQ